MSQSVDENQSPRVGVTARQNVQPQEIKGLSPDDDIGVTSDNTGKPPVAPPPPPPQPGS